MIPLRPLSGQVQVYLTLLSSLAFAALQNVTVDDAVLTGAVVPKYLPLPSNSSWNIGNNCSACAVRPDSLLAYNGTWHDTTFVPGNGVAQEIEFTFTGSALYIFFIIANTLLDIPTLTVVNFVLDDVAVSSYSHIPDTTSDYQYNVPVYANESLLFGQHNMVIRPSDLGSSVLILFDYLIYTTGTSSPVSVSTPVAFTSPLSPTESGTQGASSGQDIVATVSGVAGGVAALAIVTASLSCYRRYKRGNVGWRLVEESAVVEPFFLPPEVAPRSLVGATSLTHLTGSKFTVTLQPSTPPTSTASTATSSDVLSGINFGLVEQVELLRTEVARLHDLHQAPPEYSPG